ncbi:DUF1761 domain-containing protein [Sanyastnella coralliicola]|uniref:DUF1761 domain-containing protein n=1 Tax=Sanyastnella coralliicola TaxID=3069118 RepID=UPI0027B8E4A4|nr:DUF1761 domain-containing protein [Longitalea sp. SCSIO 12813]
MEFNYLIVAAAALVPMVVGFIWYNPKVFGTAWMNVAGMTEEKIKGGNMPVIFLVSYVLSFLLAMATAGMVIHQMSVQSLFFAQEGFMEGSGAAYDQFTALMEQFEGVHRTFGHGVLHGVIGGFFVALPILGTNAMFERKGFKYIAVNCGYWIVTLGLMGGVLCQWA